jgi:hypothetical protein
VRDGKDGEHGLVLPKWLKPALSSALGAILIGGYNAFTEFQVLKQDVAWIQRGNERRDAEFAELRREVGGMKHEQNDFHSEANSKLDRAVSTLEELARRRK